MIEREEQKHMMKKGLLQKIVVLLSNEKRNAYHVEI
jgi:hypothetical protein